MRHAFVHFDLNTSDFAGVRRFYEALFDWDFVDVDMGGNAPYAQIRPPSGPGGGLQPTSSRGTRSQWVPYVGVDDLRATLARVREAGGAVIVDYTESPGFGAQAIVQDPGGTQLGLWEIVVVAAAPAVEEVVEAEVVEDAEIVEETAGPEVVVDAPAVVEVAVTPGKKKRGGRRRAIEVVEAELAPAEVIAEAPAAPEAAAAPPKGPSKKKAGKKGPKPAAAEPEPEQTVVAKPEEVAAKKTSKRTAKKAVVEAPAAAKKPAKKAVVEAPAAAKKPAKKVVVEAPAAPKKAAKKAVIEEPAPSKKPAVAKKTTSKKPAPRGRR